MKNLERKRNLLVLSALTLFFAVALISNVTAQQYVPSPNGLISWWPGDGDFSDIQDGNDGITAGGVSFTSGKFGQAFSFNGNYADSFITIPDSPNLSPTTNKLTIQAWIKPTFGPLNGLDTVLAKRKGCINSNISYHLTLVKNHRGRPPGQISFVLGNSTCSDRTEVHSSGNVVPNDGEFHHVAATYDGSLMKVYIDGQLVGQNSRSGPLCAITSPAVISRHGGTCNFASYAAIDEIAFHDRALSAAEIQKLFNQKCSFVDVPPGYWAEDAICTIYDEGITTGCSKNPFKYCPLRDVNRAQMAVFLERGINGSDYTPPPATGIFDDVPVDFWAADWIEQLYKDGITTGCAKSPLKYCPDRAVNRAQMAVFLLRAKYGKDYEPPIPIIPLFTDVPVTHWVAGWIEQLYKEGITIGCSKNPLKYCPLKVVNRAQMAVFLMRTFGL